MNFYICDEDGQYLAHENTLTKARETAKSFLSTHKFLIIKGEDGREIDVIE